MFQQQKDLNFGYKKEKEVCPILNKFFGYNLCLQNDKWAVFDFIDNDNKVYAELKSRRVKKCQYPDIMIGYNKILKGLKQIKKGWKVYLCWCFMDKLCYYELTEYFDTSLVKFNHKCRWDRGRSEYDDIAFIPISSLKDVCNVKR